MRQIKYRGRSIKTGEMVYGCLVNNMWTYSNLSKFKEGTPVCEIITGIYESDNWQEAIEEDSNVVQVDPETVGEYTGLKDKNGEELYEGDVVIKMEQDWSVAEDWEDNDPRWNEPLPLTETNRDIVDLTHFGFWLKNEDFGYEGENLQHPSYYEKIGNIYENPELIKQ